MAEYADLLEAVGDAWQTVEEAYKIAESVGVEPEHAELVSIWKQLRGVWRGLKNKEPREGVANARP